MKPLPLDQIGWNWESHKSALWWLGLLYRNPVRVDILYNHPDWCDEKLFKENIHKQGWLRKIVLGFKIFIHLLPWLILFTLIFRLMIFEVFGVPAKSELNTLFDHFLFHITSFAIGSTLKITIIFTIVLIIIVAFFLFILAGVAGELLTESRVDNIFLLVFLALVSIFMFDSDDIQIISFITCAIAVIIAVIITFFRDIPRGIAILITLVITLVIILALDINSIFRYSAIIYCSIAFFIAGISMRKNVGDIISDILRCIAGIILLIPAFVVAAIFGLIITIFFDKEIVLIIGGFIGFPIFITITLVIAVIIIKSIAVTITRGIPRDVIKDNISEIIKNIIRDNKELFNRNNDFNSSGIKLIITVFVTFSIAFAIAFGINGSVAFGIVFGIVSGIVFGIIVNIVISFGSYSSNQVKFGISTCIISGIFISIVYGITTGIVFGVAFSISFIIGLFRIYYFPLYLIALLPSRYHLFKLHPIYWDFLCSIPFPLLERILIAHVKVNAVEGISKIDSIIQFQHNQRWGAQKAKTILIARDAARVNNLCGIESFVNKLPEGDKSYLTQTKNIKETVHEICQLQHQIEVINRPFLKVSKVNVLFAQIENFKYELISFKEPLKSEFRKAADAWLVIAKKQKEQVEAIIAKEPSPQVFRAGDPVNRAQEAFIPRYWVMGELQRQVMNITGCPGLILYGRRRMGKTTILNNLGGFLPPFVQSVFISMQSARAFTSIRDFNQLLAENFAKILPETKITASSDDSLKAIFHILEAVNNNLKPENQRLLICIDEYENLDQKIGDQTFSKDLLPTIRESIQNHRQLTWLFAGSHEITELTHAPWTSYLISAQTIEVPLFTKDETYLLLTEPMKYSTGWKNDDPERPRFNLEFWGEKGIEQIHTQAGGWPYLVQLVAGTIVDIINESEITHADDIIFEEALNQSIVKGHNVLYELMHGECKLPGEWEYLANFRRKASQPIPNSEAIYRSLKRRLLVVEENGEFRLRVPLMERWLKERG